MLIKYRSITKKDEKTNKFYTVSIVLRENGQYEIYSDFMLVHTKKLKKRPCIDIETDFHNFFFKFVIDERLPKKVGKMQLSDV